MCSLAVCVLAIGRESCSRNGRQCLPVLASFKKNIPMPPWLFCICTSSTLFPRHCSADGCRVLAIKERETEVNQLKEKIVALRKNTGEATDQKNTWSTKYEALERNFKQVTTDVSCARASSRNIARTFGNLEVL